MTSRITAMTKLVAPLVILLAGLAGTASAETAEPKPAGAAPASAPSDPAPAVQPAAPAAVSGAAEARKQCAAAMNADPQFAAEIVKVADEKAAAQRDAATLAAHVDANAHVQKNERHVIYAYVAMWLVAAAFVLFLWRRQQALNAEIAQLRRDLEAASDDSKRTEQRR